VRQRHHRRCTGHRHRLLFSRRHRHPARHYRHQLPLLPVPQRRHLELGSLGLYVTAPVAPSPILLPGATMAGRPELPPGASTSIVELIDVPRPFLTASLSLSPVAPSLDFASPAAPIVIEPTEVHRLASIISVCCTQPLLLRRCSMKCPHELRCTRVLL
jgi:hypothetical protein